MASTGVAALSISLPLTRMLARSRRATPKIISIISVRPLPIKPKNPSTSPLCRSKSTSATSMWPAPLRHAQPTASDRHDVVCSRRQDAAGVELA